MNEFRAALQPIVCTFDQHFQIIPENIFDKYIENCTEKSASILSRLKHLAAYIQFKQQRYTTPPPPPPFIPSDFYSFGLTLAAVAAAALLPPPHPFISFIDNVTDLLLFYSFYFILLSLKFIKYGLRLNGTEVA